MFSFLMIFLGDFLDSSKLWLKQKVFSPLCSLMFKVDKGICILLWSAKKKNFWSPCPLLFIQNKSSSHGTSAIANHLTPRYGRHMRIFPKRIFILRNKSLKNFAVLKMSWSRLFLSFTIFYDVPWDLSARLAFTESKLVAIFNLNNKYLLRFFNVSFPNVFCKLSSESYIDSHKNNF